MKYVFSLLLLSALRFLHAQDLTPDEQHAVLIVKLVNKNGGVFPNISVAIKTLSDVTVATGISNPAGAVQTLVPVNNSYKIVVDNYPEIQIVKIPPGGFSKKTMKLIYEPDAVKKQKEWALTPQQEEEIDNLSMKLPANTWFDPAQAGKLAATDYLLLYTLKISTFKGAPLQGEKVTLTGMRRKRSFTSLTNSKGEVKLLLPKGDRYSVNFTYDSLFSQFEVPYLTGQATRDFTLDYIGTAEILRIRKEEEDRIRAEEIRLKKEEAEFRERCKKLGITYEEGRRREIMGWDNQTEDTVVLTVFNRNPQWKQKLVVCDLTGSMSPYSQQLLLWYQLNYKMEQHLQFVFFNDGNNLPDEKKIIGKTGGIYYAQSKNYDSLVRIMTRVIAAGSGGDCPENNLEALINGTRMCKEPYREIIMIADNLAPVKDIELLPNFRQPVHIIVCGVTGEIHPDYLRIAWKTGGSIHTMEQDITDIAKTMDGEIVTIGKMKYRLSGGKFYKTDEM